MCQPKSKGGKRCAAHHPATIAAKYAIKSTTRLEQGQIDYAFKSLRAMGKDQPDPSPEQYQQYLNDEKDRILASEIPQNVKRKMIAKVERAMEDNQVPSGATYYACQQLRRQTNIAWRLLANQLREQAQERGESPASTMQRFRSLYARSVTPRNSSKDYSETLDPKTQVVLNQMREGYQPRFEDTPRITRTSTGNKVITSQGYDPEDGRLEIQVNNGKVYALHSVSPEDYERFMQQPKTVFNELRMNPSLNYENQNESMKDAFRVWCDKCKRFRLASGHVCQDGNVTGKVVPRAPKSVDDIYEKVRTAGLNSVPSAEYPLVTPAWAAEDREVVSLDDDAYSDVEGAQGRTPSGARAITVDVEKLREAIDQGKKVEVSLGRKIAIAGSDRTEFYEATVPVTVERYHGTGFYSTSARWQDAKCTCDAYRTNGRCPHLYPHEGSQSLNRFLQRDVQNSISRMRSLGMTSSGEDAYGFIPSGQPIEGTNLCELSQDDLEQIRYALSQGDDASVYLLGNLDSPTWSERLSITLDVTPTGTVRASGTPTRLVELYRSAINQELNRTNFTATRLAAAAERTLSDGWELRSETRQEYLDRFRDHSQNGYLSNPEQFVSDYKAAAADTGPLEFTEGPVTNGYLSSGPDEPDARGFGIEIEFDGASNYDVAEALNRAGLADSDDVAYYHQNNDFTAWRVEEDCSVSGEVVSPILYDNEESWSQVRRVCEAMKSVGARATVNTGNHVHIGAGNMSGDDRRGVLAATAAHQDVLRRISTNPETQTHRSSSGNGYSAAFSSYDVANVYNSRGSSYINTDRYRMVNFENDNTIEFRDPDGTLDPGHIQANVMMSAALMAAGERGTWDNLSETTIRRQRVGANATRQAYVDNAIEDEDEKIIASNISLMTTLDALFPDERSRKRILNVAARVPWQSSGRND